MDYELFFWIASLIASGGTMWFVLKKNGGLYVEWVAEGDCK